MLISSAYKSRIRNRNSRSIHFWLLINIIFNTGSCVFAVQRPEIREIYKNKIKTFHSDFIQRKPHHDLMFKEPDFSQNGYSDFANQICNNHTLTFVQSVNTSIHTLDRLYPNGNFTENPFLENLNQSDDSWKIPTREDIDNVVFNVCQNMINEYYRLTGRENMVTEKYRAVRQAPAKDNSDFLKHTTIVSHLVNGIYLQSGLMDGKIPIDELAGEILNFGSVKVSDVVNFKSDKVTALTNKLKEVRNTLSDKDNDDGIKKLEAEAIKWNQMRIEYDSIGDDVKIPGKQKYMDEIVELNKTTSDLVGIENLLGTYTRELASILSYDLTDNADLAKLQGSLIRFDTAEKDFNDRFNKLKAATETLNKYNSLKNGAEIFKPLETMIHIMSERGASPGSAKQHLETVKKNIDAVVGSMTPSTTSIQDIKNIKELAMGRTSRQTKKHAAGFSKGVIDLKELVKDVKDPWIEKITSAEGSNLQKIADGLQPLSKITEGLNKVDIKLQPLFSESVHQSLLAISTLQESISILSADSTASHTALVDYTRCKKGETSSDEYDPTQQFLNDVKLLAQLTAETVGSAEKVNVADLLKDVNALADVIRSKGDPKGLAASLKDKIEKSKKMLNGQKIVDLVTKLKGGDGTNEITFVSAWNRQKDAQKCLHAINGHIENSEKLSRALQVIQSLRAFDANKFGNVEQAASTVTQISQELPALKSIPDSMKKVAKDPTTRINKLPDAAKSSKSIGQSVSSLQYAYGLKKLESDVAQLKSVGTIVAAEIQKIANPSDRKTVEDQWGDHQKHVAELEGSLAKINAFDSKIDISKAKTIGEYGAPLKDLASLTDAKINAGDKFKALETLIQSADPKNKDALEAAKKTLGTIATLDLQFSSHKGQFQSAPAAFQTFHDFLKDFFANETEKKVEEGGFPWLTAIFIFLAIVAFCGVVIFAVWYRKHSKDKKEKERLEEEEARLERQRQHEAEVKRMQQANQNLQQQTEVLQQETQVLQQQRDGLEHQRDGLQHQRDGLQQLNRGLQDNNRILQRDNRAATTEAERLRMMNEQKDREKQDRIVADKKLKSQNRKEFKGALRRWCRSLRYDNENHAAELMNTYLRTAFLSAKVDYAASIQFLGVEKHRYPTDVPCKIDTAVSFQLKGDDSREVRVHANFFDTISKKKKFIATQGPLKETFEDFWHMILHYDVEFIVMLCQIMENGDEKCGQYFHPDVNGVLTFGDITVTTTKSETILDGHVVKKTFSIVDAKKRYGDEPKVVTFYNKLTWPDKSVPVGHEITCKLLDMVNKSEKPVVVHCSAGIGRTVSFIGIDVLVEEVENNPELFPIQGLTKLRDSRALGVQNAEQLLWLLLGVVYVLSKKYDFGMTNYDEQYEFFKKIQPTLKKDMKQVVAKNNAEKNEAKKKAMKLVEAAEQKQRVKGGAEVKPEESEIFELGIEELERAGLGQDTSESEVDRGEETEQEIPQQDQPDEQEEEDEEDYEYELGKFLTEEYFDFWSVDPVRDFRCVLMVEEVLAARTGAGNRHVVIPIDEP